MTMRGIGKQFMKNKGSRVPSAIGRHSMLCSVLMVMLLMSKALVAQPAPVPFSVVPYDEVNVTTEIPQSGDPFTSSRVFEAVDKTWIIVRFESFDLGDGFLTIRSIDDPSQIQTFDQEKLGRWNGESARFVGSKVRIKVHANSDDHNPSYKIKELLGGNRVDVDVGPTTEESLANESLGIEDNRTSSFDDRIGRIMPHTCTAFILNNGAILTAGHCVNRDMILLEFRVPPSADDGTPMPSPVEHQFKIKRSNVEYRDNGPGDDWAVFSVYENDHGLTPDQIYGGFDFTVEVHDGQIAVRGFGRDAGMDNLTQQHDVGDVLRYERYRPGGIPALIQHNAGTQGGNSGSPIFFVDASGKVIGIHTHGDNNRSDGILVNEGTSLTQSGLYNAIAKFGRPVIRDIASSSVNKSLKEGDGSIRIRIDHGVCFSKIYRLLVLVRFSDDILDPGEAVWIEGFSVGFRNKTNGSMSSRSISSIWPRTNNRSLNGVFERRLSALVGSVHISEIESQIEGIRVACE